MPSNGLSKRRDIFPRPPVCKASNPNGCPKAELTLITRSVLFNVDWTWALDCILTVFEGTIVGPFTLTAATIGGNPELHIPIDAGIPFTFAVENCPPSSIVTLFLKAEDVRVCKYLGIAQVAIPANPV